MTISEEQASSLLLQLANYINQYVTTHPKTGYEELSDQQANRLIHLFNSPKLTLSEEVADPSMTAFETFFPQLDDESKKFIRWHLGFAILELSKERARFYFESGITSSSYPDCGNEIELHISSQLKNAKLLDVLFGILKINPCKTLRVTLNQCDLAYARELIAALSNNTHIDELAIIDPKFCDEDMPELILDVITKLSITQLALIGIHMTDNMVSHVARALAYNKSLRALKLNRCAISNDGVLHIASALKLNTTLKNLFIQLNIFDDTGVSYLADALKENSSLTHLFFEGNRITIKCIDSLTDALAYNASLWTIYTGLPNNSAPTQLRRILQYNFTFTFIDINRDQALTTLFTRNQSLRRSLDALTSLPPNDPTAEKLLISLEDHINFLIYILDDIKEKSDNYTLIERAATKIIENINAYLTKILNAKFLYYKEMESFPEQYLESITGQVNTLLQYPQQHPNHEKSRFRAFEIIYVPSQYHPEFNMQAPAFCLALLQTCTELDGSLRCIFKDAEIQRAFDSILMAIMGETLKYQDPTLDTKTRQTFINRALLRWLPQDIDQAEFLLQYLNTELIRLASEPEPENQSTRTAITRKIMDVSRRATFFNRNRQFENTISDPLEQAEKNRLPPNS